MGGTLGAALAAPVIVADPLWYFHLIWFSKYLDREQLDRRRTTASADACLDARRPGWFPTKPQY